MVVLSPSSLIICHVIFISMQAKELVYDERSRSHNLKEAWICRASANQRKGRAGRTVGSKFLGTCWVFCCWQLVRPFTYHQIRDQEFAFACTQRRHSTKWQVRPCLCDDIICIRWSQGDNKVLSMNRLFSLWFQNFQFRRFINLRWKACAYK